MRSISSVRSLVALFLLLAPIPGEAEDERQEERQDRQTATHEKQQPVEQKDIVYTPPSPAVLSAPGGRVGGSSRGGELHDVVLFVLAPEDHTGLTTQEQPALYWYVSPATSAPIVFTLVTDQADEPLAEKLINVPRHSGLQSVRLTDYAVRLSPGVHYKWSITLVMDTTHPSRNLLAEGAIEYIEPSPALRARLTQAPRDALPRLYAAEGVWYDAISVLADLLEAAPHDAWLRRQRASLLQQVGLPEVEW